MPTSLRFDVLKRAVWTLVRACGLSTVLCLGSWAQTAAVPVDKATNSTSFMVSAPESLAMYGPLVAALLTDAGLQPAISFYPTARSRMLFVGGSVDAEFFRIAKLPSDYPAHVTTIGPLQSVRFGMFIRADDKILAGKPEAVLWEQPLGYTRGTLAVEGLIRARGLEKAQAVERDYGIKSVQAGRLSVFIDSERLMLAHLQETNATGSLKLAATVLEEPTYLLLHPKARGQEAAIKQTVLRWLESGRWQREYQAINKQNGLPPDMSLVKGPFR